MKTMTFLKTTVAVATLTVALGTIPTVSEAKAYNLCLLDSVPPSLIEKVTRQANFPELLASMFVVCPIAALALSEAATASTGTGPAAEPDRGERRERGEEREDRVAGSDEGASDGGETGGGETGGGETGGGDTGGGETGGGGNGDGGNGGGGNGGGGNGGGGNGGGNNGGGINGGGNNGGGNNGGRR